MTIRSTAPLMLGALALGMATPHVQAQEFDVLEPIVEINATDGDVGFHVLLDGDPWKVARLYDPDGDRIFRAHGTDDNEEQGTTEMFTESAEPPCWDNGDVDPEEIVTVEDFIERYETGTYTAMGHSIDSEMMTGEGELTHELPAAPVVNIDTTGGVVTISWLGGTDLGNCAVPDSITDPEFVPVVRWEVVVEPNEDELPGGELPAGVPFGKLTIQVPAGVSSLVVPGEYMNAYTGAGVDEFKGEVGAREASGNQTFTEFEFSL